MASTRILLQLVTPGSLPADVVEVLGNFEAGPAHQSHPNLPGLYRAEVPSGVDVDRLLTELNQLPSLRFAELETWSQDF